MSPIFEVTFTLSGLISGVITGYLLRRRLHRKKPLQEGYAVWYKRSDGDRKIIAVYREFMEANTIAYLLHDLIGSEEDIIYFDNIKGKYPPEQFI